MVEPQAPILRDVGPWPFTWVGDLLRVIYACRVAVIGVALGFLLLTRVPQARDLFLVFSGSAIAEGADYSRNFEMFLRWFFYFIIHVLAWSAMVQASAEDLLGSNAWLIGPARKLTALDMEIYDRRFRWIVIALPYLLALSTFVLVAWGYHLALTDLPSATGGSLSKSAAIIRSGSLGFYLALACGIAMHALLWRRNLGEIQQGEMHPGFRVAGHPPSDALERRAVHLHANAWLGLGLLFLALAAIWGGSVVQAVSGVYLVPILLGAWIPLFSKIGTLSQRTRFPFTLLILALWLFAANHWGHSNRVMRAEAEPRAGMGFDTAVAAWKNANCRGPDACPRPILVTIAGGASRAAFFAATVLGELIDNPCLEPGRDCEPPGATTPLLGQRIFAISGVSGGSLGAVQALAAMNDAITGPQQRPAPPCRVKEPYQYFKTPNPESWRDCLQTLASGDFLSKTVLALVTSEPFLALEPLIGRLWRRGYFLDRAAILEQTWIDAYRAALNDPQGAAATDAGLGGPFSELGRAKRDGKSWLPLLLLNATSQDSGKRVLASQLNGELGTGHLFVDAFEVDQFLRSQPADPAPACPVARFNGHDLTVASAALLSARFPIVSPAGHFSPDCLTGLRVVDGGYFENDGATTANEIAIALRNAGLTPVVLHIANEPIDQIADPERDKHPLLRKDSWLALLTTPLDTVLATREARGAYALAALRGTVRAENFVDFLVYGEPKVDAKGAMPQVEGVSGFRSISQSPLKHECFERAAKDVSGATSALKQVSMSWWLSKPVQEYLDRQTYVRRNCDGLLRVRHWLEEKMVADPAAAKTAPTAAPIKAPDR
ncbi:hypothetical protein [Bosea sp. 685]|uniref:hypothetical protein n=1 Tax=Bosea sp. 685 TaxID=3080057 RepID=UPI0028929F42|nr:hypothetical protein [Bosea sp. 685]WNJ92733.1 hypothetical protein RMR04_10705 [Bosea sp. 685]